MPFNGNYTSPIDSLIHSIIINSEKIPLAAKGHPAKVSFDIVERVYTQVTHFPLKEFFQIQMNQRNLASLIIFKQEAQQEGRSQITVQL